MDRGVKFIICIIALILIIIAEKGVPVKFKRWDLLKYIIMFMVLLMDAGYFIH